MGKIVKYCQSCDESFAEKFGFCPNCGKSMQAFEMNPLGGAMRNVAEKTAVEKIETAPQTPPVKVESVKIPETAAATVSTVAAASTVKAETISKPVSSETKLPVAPSQSPIRETKTFAASASASNGGDKNYKQQASNDGYRTIESGRYGKADDGFHVTVIEEKNSKQRNLLLLGALLLMMSIASGAMIYSLFNYNLSVAAIGDESGLSIPITDVIPTKIEDVPEPKADKTEGGGGGGGGRQDKEPISKGELPPQFKEKPMLTPSKEDISVTNPALRVQRATQGPDDIIPKNRSATNGDPNATNTNPSNGYSLANSGMGQNGKDGIGDNGELGVGRNGKGGRGSAPGSRYGDKPGDGGRVDTNDPNDQPPAIVAKAVVEPFKIISRPKPPYTDEARKNAITGVVRVKVTFLSSGQVGSVVPVSGLPYGLTESAIAAAKNIKFEPMKKNGVPQATSRVIEYSFTIY